MLKIAIAGFIMILPLAAKAADEPIDLAPRRGVPFCPSEEDIKKILEAARRNCPHDAPIEETIATPEVEE